MRLSGAGAAIDRQGKRETLKRLLSGRGLSAAMGLFIFATGTSAPAQTLFMVSED